MKNKVAAPFRDGEFDVIYGRGISHSGSLLDLGVDASIVEKSGSWFSYSGNRLGQGREAAKAWLEDAANAEVAGEIERRVLEHYRVERVMGSGPKEDGPPPPPPRGKRKR